MERTRLVGLHLLVSFAMTTKKMNKNIYITLVLVFLTCENLSQNVILRFSHL